MFVFGSIIRSSDLSIIKWNIFISLNVQCNEMSLSCQIIDYVVIDVRASHSPTTISTVMCENANYSMSNSSTQILHKMVSSSIEGLELTEGFMCSY